MPFVVLTPVEFDRQSSSRAVEIEGIRTDRVLAPELRPHPVATQATPELTLGVGRPFAEKSPEL